MIKHQNWWQLSIIQVGGVICLPVILVGQSLGQKFGLGMGLLSILLGNIILLFLGILTVKMSAENRKTTTENALEYFGKKGVSFFAFFMTISFLAWFGIQLNIMTLSVLELLDQTSFTKSMSTVVNVILGLMITFFGRFGLRAINTIANLSIPLMILTLVYAFLTLENKPQVSSNFSISLGGISLVVALAITFVIDLPTYYRHARSSKDGIISMVIIFAIILPFLEVLGVYLSVGNSAQTIVDLFKREGNLIWNIWVALFLILAGWTTNNVNLYSGSMSFGSLLKNYSESKRILLAGCLGTFAACFNLLDHFAFVLDIIGVLIASMGAVIITCYLLSCFENAKISYQKYHLQAIALLMGTILGFLSIMGWTITSIPLLDASIGSSLTILIFQSKLRGRALNKLT